MLQMYSYYKRLQFHIPKKTSNDVFYLEPLLQIMHGFFLDLSFATIEYITYWKEENI
jgi:hypothetical protein